MGFITFFLSRILPAGIVSLAVLLGWLGQAEIPEGRFFATFFPLTKFELPATIFGHGKMTGTPLVPADLTPRPRPENEKIIGLTGGYQMPQNGLGMCCRPSAYDDELAKRTVLWYLLLGGRLIDGAHIYLNHRAVGEGIQEAIRRGVPREEIFVTTKIWPSHYGYNTTKETIPRFLEELNLDYIDLVLMHMPQRVPPFLKIMECSKKGLSTKQCRQETFRALSELREQGSIRSIGVSNFAVHHLQELAELEGVAPVAVDQIPYNPWSPQAWVDTFEYCQRNDVVVTAYNSLGGFFQHAQANTVATLNQIANKHNKTVAQIMLRWAIQKNAVVIPGTGNPKHMEENLSVYAFELSEEDMLSIDELRKDEGAKKFFSMQPME